MTRMCQLPDSTGLLLDSRIALRHVPVDQTPDRTVPLQNPGLIATPFVGIEV
ncbi:hypothetical protein [Adonisia turfae]|uniref:hypothetical protein n=1 Tax=Adonisia turfae TaxID=2950184 RepID=UPI0013D6CBC0|nr:hypothetical protein [Adonisia turfae]